MPRHTLENILKTLVAFETVAGNDHEFKKTYDWIEGFVEHTNPNLVIKHHSFGGIPSLTITTQHTTTPVLWLSAHIDVVPAPKKSFKLRRDGDLLYGRGTYDMKFAIACYLYLLSELEEHASEYDFGIMLTSDEETGGENGAPRLLEQGYTSKTIVVPDGGEDWQLETHAKGFWDVKFISKGVSAHGSRPWEGENAIETLNDFLVEVRGLFKCEEDDNCRLDDGSHYYRTIAISNIEGGNGAINKIPSYASATANIRFVTRQEYMHIDSAINEVLDRYPSVTSETISIANPLDHDITDKYSEIFVECMPKKYRESHTGIVSHGASDARSFGLADVPTIVTRPKGGGAHSDDEWVDLLDLERFYKTIHRFITKVAR